MARSAYIYILDDESRDVLVPFTVKHELESYLNENFEDDPELYVPATVDRVLDGRASDPVTGEIVRSDDGTGWVVRFPREVVGEVVMGGPTTEPAS